MKTMQCIMLRLLICVTFVLCLAPSVYCQNNQLTNLDVSHNLKLSYLSCGGNLLTGLDISNNHALTSLTCANNQLSRLNINCAAGLEALQCQRNHLTSLDISKCPSLMQLVSNTEPNTSSGVVRYGPNVRSILSYDEGVTLITAPIPDLILPAQLITIGEEAFSGGAFTYVRLSENTTTIGKNAFANCANLTFIYIPEVTTAIDPEAFGNRRNLTIIGKAGSTAETYAAAHNFTFAAVS